MNCDDDVTRSHNCLAKCRGGLPGWVGSPFGAMMPRKGSKPTIATDDWVVVGARMPFTVHMNSFFGPDLFGIDENLGSGCP